MSTRRHTFVRRLGIFVGSVFLLAGAAETIRVVTSGDGGLPFWFGTLVGGGALVLLGTLRLQSRPGLALAAVIVGALAGSIATVWTVILPILALLLVVLRLTTPSAPSESSVSSPTPSGPPA